MKIDLHCHTKKTKKGDNESRNVTAEIFVEKLEESQVKFAAITNHNHFDKEQYLSLSSEASTKSIEIWPGIELDVQAKISKGHIIVICDPAQLDEFDSLCSNIIAKTTPDNFVIEIDDFFEKFIYLNIIIIAHHHKKSKGFTDHDLNYIKLNSKAPYLFEPISLKSVGIMYGNGINAFIGSDIQDWNNYPNKKLPELKMDIKNFNTFLLLLKKDPQVIKTFLDQKGSELIKISPFSDEKDNEKIEIEIFEDINIIFGGKGTGKSKILKALNTEYTNKIGKDSISYYTGESKDANYKDLVNVEISIDHFKLLEIENCKNEFKSLKEWQVTQLITTEEFKKGIESRRSAGKIKKFGFTRASLTNTVISEDKYTLEKSNYKNIIESIEELKKISIENYLDDNDREILNNLLNKMVNSCLEKVKKEGIRFKSLKLEEFTIEKMQTISKLKTGTFSIPPKTGMLAFYSNALSVYRCSNKIISFFNKPNKSIRKKIGKVLDKGDIYLKTEIAINPLSSQSFNYQSGKPKIRELKSIYDSIKSITDNSFTTSIASKINDFINNCKDKCFSLEDCFGVKSFVCREDDSEYEPSAGEKSMLFLNNSLIDDNKRVYILDEPELSVGHKYINDVIVPRLKELSILDKIVIISTHDANIAIRTLPLNTIYREYKKTYKGNLFLDILIDNNDNKKSWVKTSIEYLEGGKEAFEERGEAYEL